MPVKTRFIFNPIANLGRARELEPALHSVANELGGGDWRTTEFPNHAIELAHQAALEGYERVIAMGGDGTMHEVVNGLMRVEASGRPLLGSVPVGSGNDFSFAAGMPSDPAQALRQVLAGKPHQVDLGLLELADGKREYMTNAVGLGFDTIVTIYSRKVPILHGFPVYLISVLETILLNHHPFHLTITSDGRVWEGKYIMVVMSNGKREGGGFLVTPDAAQDDGRLDYVTVSDLNRLQMIGLVPKFINGSHKGLPKIELGRFEEMKIQANRGLQIHMDGEVLTGFDSTVTSLTVRILPGALTILR